MKIVMIVLLGLLVASCTDQPVKTGLSDSEAKRFTTFGQFIEHRHPGWKLEGINEEISAAGGCRYYYISVAKEGEIKVAILATANMQMQDGTNKEVIFEPKNIFLIPNTDSYEPTGDSDPWT